MTIEGKNIILTGASSGFGRALIDKLLAYKDIKIIAAARHIENIPVINDNLIPFKCDLSKQAEVDRLFDFAEKTYDSIDIFIANAGFAYYEKIEEADWRHIEDIFNLNVTSPIYSLQKIIALKKQNITSFVLVASAAALIALPGFALYTATKFALNGFTDAFRYECAENIKFSVVYPVAAHTNFFKRAADNSPVPFPRQSVEAVVNTIIKAIKTGRHKLYPSKLFRYLYPVLRICPFIISLFQAKQSKDFKEWLKNKRQ